MFDGYKRVVDGEVGGGKQKKAKGTGVYTNTKDGRKCYIKRADTFPADDLAEYISSKLLRALVGDNSAECNLIVNKETREVFLVSYFADGTEHKPLQKQGEFSGCWTEESKNEVYAILNAGGLTDGFSRTLAACMLIGEFDVHPGNFCLYKAPNGKRRISKIDHGWGLHNICKGHNVSFTQTKIPAGRYGHSSRPMPLNHFTNYPKLTASEDFRSATMKVLATAREANIREIVNNSLNKLEELYPHDYKKQLELLSMIAMHIGDDKYCDSLRNKTSDDEQLCELVKERIASQIVFKIFERQHYMLQQAIATAPIPTKAPPTPAPDFETEHAREGEDHKNRAAKAHKEAVEKEKLERKLREEAEKKHREEEVLRNRAEELHKEVEAKRKEEEELKRVAKLEKAREKMSGKSRLRKS